MHWVNAKIMVSDQSVKQLSQPNSTIIYTNFQWTWPLNQFTAFSCTYKPRELILMQPKGIQRYSCAQCSEYREILTYQTFSLSEA